MGDANNLDDETYSLIFTSLKHPIRRSILRMLSHSSLSYSEILQTLNIDSGHLSYHLENLGDLIVSNNGHYRLSSFGKAAVKLMDGVEDQRPALSKHKFKPKQFLAAVYPLVLALALIIASFHLVTYSELVSTQTSSTANLLYPLYANIPLSLQVGESMSVNVNVAHRDPLYGRGFGVSGGFQDWTFHIPSLERTLTGWDEAQIWVDSSYNMSTLMAYYSLSNVSMPVWNNTTQTNETIPMTPEMLAWFSVNPFETTKPYRIELQLQTPDDTSLMQTLEWDDYVASFEKSSSPHVPVKQAGTYAFTFTNVGSLDWNSFLIMVLQFQHFEKPYFYWGIVGLVAALCYIIFVSMTALKNRHKPEG
jgi:hypothetical protein